VALVPLYWPDGHVLHATSALAVYWPAAQAVQVPAPAVSAFLPAAHVVQPVALAAEYWPAGQFTHALPMLLLFVDHCCPLLLYLPSGQSQMLHVLHKPQRLQPFPQEVQ
jgi:hypothetical protein